MHELLFVITCILMVHHPCGLR